MAEKKNQVASKAATDSGRYRLFKSYKEEIVPALMKERGYTNVNEVPALEKIVVNMRMGDIKDNSKSVSAAIKELEAICGQKALVTKAKKSVATLRGLRMYEFFDKLVSIALPRVRDFRGISGKSFDGRGNYALGVKEHIIFPEVSYELIEKVRGFDVCVVTTAKSDDEAKALLVKLGMPFKN